MKKLKKIMTIMVLIVMLGVPLTRLSIARSSLPDGTAENLSDTKADYLWEYQTFNNFSVICLTEAYNQSYLLGLDNPLKNALYTIAGNEKSLLAIEARNEETQDQNDIYDITDVLELVRYKANIVDLEGNPDDGSSRDEVVNRYIYAPLMNKYGVQRSAIDFKIELSFPEELMLKTQKYNLGINTMDAKVEGLTNNKFVMTKNTTTEEYEAVMQKLIEKEVEAGVISNGESSTGNTENQTSIASGLFFAYVHVTATVNTADESIPYELVLGDDENWYLRTVEFETELSYSAKNTDGSKAEGKVVDGVYRPDYYENELNKVDTTATATIKAKNGEKIVAVKDSETVEMKADGSANSLGWYYPDTADKTTIAKDYPFATYDNIKAWGHVEETVILVGETGRTDTQKPTIEWTFRIKKIDTTKDDDKNTTVVITYNLPVNVKTIPDGWSAIYDDDGITCHRITKTIPYNEGYNKDVTVYQLRGDDKEVEVTTHVTVEPQAHAKTGESVIVVFAVIGLVVFALFIRRRLSK